VKAYLYQWLKTNSVLLFNAGSLVATFVVKSGLGYAYWWVAARQFSPAAVGVASAAISAMTLLGTFCMLGLGTLLIRELPRQPGQEVALISAALLVVASLGGCIGLLFALGVPSLSADLQPLRASGQTVALFALGVGLATMNLVLDQVLIGLLRGDLQLWRNILFAGAKLAALATAGLWLVARGGLTIVATWILADALSFSALAAFAAARGKWTISKALPQWGLVRKLGPSALQHHLLNLLLIGPNLALPALATVLISATANGWFYVAYLIADVVYVVPQALVTALYAVSSAQPAVLARKVRLTMGLAVVTCAVANVFILAGGRQLLGLFGPSYAQQGLWSLRLLGLGAFPFLLKDLYVAIARIEDRIARALLPLAASAVLEVGLAVLGARLGGLTGLSLGWDIAVCMEALLMAPAVYRIAASGPAIAYGRALREGFLLARPLLRAIKRTAK
jgi:O-antigen/teichoic acid export membrane protein